MKSKWDILEGGQILRSGITILEPIEMVKDTKNSFVNGVAMRLSVQNLKIKSITAEKKNLGVMTIDILKDYGKKVNTHSKKLNYEMPRFPPAFMQH